MVKSRFSSVLAVLCLAAATSACGSKGQFTPYTDGSRIEKGSPETASLVASCIEPNGVFHQPQYSLTIQISEGSRKTIRFGFLVEGDASIVSKDAVRVTVSRAHGMTVESDDTLLQELIQKVVIDLRYAPETRQNTKVSATVDHIYVLGMKMYDENNRLVGEFQEQIKESSETYTLGAKRSYGPPESMSPTAPSNIFHWVESLARSKTATPKTK